MAESQNPIPPTDNIPPTAPQPTNQDNVIQDAREDLLKMDIVADPERAVGRLNRSMIGSSGTRIFGELFDEEYLSSLNGMRRADEFDEMVRSSDTITMLLTARKNPVLKAKWGFEPAKGDTPEEEELNKQISERCEHEFFERMEQDFKELVEEILTFEEHGYSMFERVHEIVDDPKFGRYVGYKKIAWRSQRTIERWTLHNSGNLKGKIASVFQQSDGDLEAHINIPGRFITVFTLRKKGDNYEGLSALRPIFGNWKRKEKFLKLLAIGLERYAINTAIGKVPAGKENDPEREIFKTMLKRISSHQNNFMTLAEGWEVDFLKNPFDVEKVVKAIAREDEGMVKSFVANHLNLGQGGAGGAYALGSDLSDQFLSIIENDAEIIIRRFNKEIVREFVDLNFGKQSRYPKLTVSGINDKFSKEFAEIMKSLADNKFLSATENLEEWLRDKLGIPALLEADKEVIPDVRKTEQASFFGEDMSVKDDSQNEPDGSFIRHDHISNKTTPTTIEFADQKTKSKISSQLNKSSMAIAEGMQENLRLRGQALIDKMFNSLKGQPKSKWKTIIRNQENLPMINDYKKKLKRALAETAGRAVSQARNEVPGGRKVQFAEGIKSRMTFAEADDNFKNLPKSIQDLILTDVDLVSDKQFTDIRNAVLLAASNGTEETEDLRVLRKRAEEELSRRVDGQGETGINGSIVVAASGTAVNAYNKARIEFFQEPEVLEKIEAFQFLNSDPVSPICKDLNGKIFPKDDPESAKFLPPLHPNCKSFIAPVFQLQGKKVATEGLKPSNPELEKFKTR